MFGSEKWNQVPRELRRAGVFLAGIKVDNDTVTFEKKTWSLKGAQAELTGSTIGSRFTATRFLVMGPLALAARKKTGEAWLLIAGPECDIALKVDAKKAAKANEFVVLFNQYAHSL